MTVRTRGEEMCKHGVKPEFSPRTTYAWSSRSNTQLQEAEHRPWEVGVVRSRVRHYWQNRGTALNPLPLLRRHRPGMRELGFVILTCFFLSSAELTEENIKVQPLCSPWNTLLQKSLNKCQWLTLWIILWAQLQKALCLLMLLSKNNS